VAPPSLEVDLIILAWVTLAVVTYLACCTAEDARQDVLLEAHIREAMTRLNEIRQREAREGARLNEKKRNLWAAEAMGDEDEIEQIMEAYDQAVDTEIGPDRVRAEKEMDRLQVEQSRRHEPWHARLRRRTGW
jgi:hypothetical protein